VATTKRRYWQTTSLCSTGLVCHGCRGKLVNLEMARKTSSSGRTRRRMMRSSRERCKLEKRGARNNSLTGAIEWGEGGVLYSYGVLFVKVLAPLEDKCSQSSNVSSNSKSCGLANGIFSRVPDMLSQAISSHRKSIPGSFPSNSNALKSALSKEP
jgi:hypothetical protein